MAFEQIQNISNLLVQLALAQDYVLACGRGTREDVVGDLPPDGDMAATETEPGPQTE
jgi:hypothetical protein